MPRRNWLAAFELLESLLTQSFLGTQLRQPMGWSAEISF